MAWTYSGTATSYLDLFGKLKDALVAEGWTVLRWRGVTNRTGTYSQTGTTMTVSITSHGYSIGDRVYLYCTSGTGNDGWYVILATDFTVDSFKITSLSTETTSGNVEIRPELIIKGPGAGGRSDFYLGFVHISGYYNIRISGLTGYTETAEFTAQPGYSTTYCRHLNLWTSSIPYWLSVTDDRFMLVAQVSTKYHWLGGGLLKTYGTDAQYGYPLFVFGADHDDGSLPYSSVSDAWEWSLFAPGGAWMEPQDYHTPATGTTIDGLYPVWPLYLYDSVNIYGEVEGLVGFYSYGTNAGDTITIGSDVYWAFPNSSSVSFGSFLALKEV